MIDFYKKIKNKSSIINDIFGIINNENKWGLYFAFEIKIIPKEIIDKDFFLEKLYKEHNFNACVLKINSNYFYTWHHDNQYIGGGKGRLCAINMLLSTEHQSHCLFTNQKKEDTLKEVIEIKYEKNTYYAFNSEKLHCILNLEKPRYLFSIQFKDNTFSYNNLLKYLEKNDFL
jgi:hypothetical protein